MIKVTVDTDGYIERAFVCRLNYVLDFIQNHPSAPHGLKISLNDDTSAKIVINYSQKGGKYQIIPQKIYFDHSINQMIRPIETEFRYYEFFLTGFANNGGSEFFPIDIFETIFFHISRYEEWYADENKMDHHGTLASDNQYLVKKNAHNIPIVDLLVLHFYEKIELKPKLLCSTISISHDIDVIHKHSSFYKFMRGYANILFYQPNIRKKLIVHTKSYFNYILNKQKDPYDTFDWLLIKNNSKISQKIIYWLTGGNTNYEGFFRIQEPKVNHIIKISKEHGYKIGLHPSYNTIVDKAMMNEELQTLNTISSNCIKDIRQHYLRFDIKKTGKILDELGIKTDSSLGFRDKIGFRCGTGFPYHLYDFDRECAFGFIEIPLVVMDIAAMRECNWDSVKFVQYISAFLEMNKFNTNITFNFHNSFFDPVQVDAEFIKEWYIKTFH